MGLILCLSANRLAEVERKRLKTSGNFRNHERRSFQVLRIMADFDLGLGSGARRALAAAVEREIR